MFPARGHRLLIQGGYDIAFNTKAPTPMLLQVHLRPELRKRLKTPERLRFDPPVPFRTYTDSFGNICTRLVTPRGLLNISNRFVIRDSGKPDVMPVKARQAEVEDLPDEVLVYLLGSRYCDTTSWRPWPGRNSVRSGAAGRCSRPSWITATSA